MLNESVEGEERGLESGMKIRKTSGRWSGRSQTRRGEWGGGGGGIG